MNRHLLVVVVSLSSLPAGLNAAAPESVRLDTAVYVFRDRDFRSIEIPGTRVARAAHIELLRSPATAHFDAEMLSLDGSRLSWSGGRPPQRFTPVATPDISLQPGKPVSLLAAVPAQYVEKVAGADFRLREIGADSSDAPHWQLTFTLEKGIAAGGDMPLTCVVDVATVSARETLPGVQLDVGKPILSRFSEKVRLEVRPGEWLGLAVRTASDYSLLAFLKVASPHEAAGVARVDRLMNAAEFAQFATYYYRNPQPERIPTAIRSLAPSGFLDTAGRHYPYQHAERAYTCVGFFAEVFADNPGRVPEWRKLIDTLPDGEVRTWLRKALVLHRSGENLGFGPDNTSVNSQFDEDFEILGAFFASGSPRYVQMLARRVGLVRDANDTLFDAGAEAMVLLARSLPHHPLIRPTLEVIRDDLAPADREMVDDLLNKDMKAVLERVRDMDRRPYRGLGRDLNLLPWRRAFSEERN